MRNVALNFPKSILIETLNLCQGECKFCPYKTVRSNEQPIYLSFERYMEMIREISKYGIKRLTLFNNNEPLIDPRIFDFVRYAALYLDGVEITLSTNGRLLSTEVLIKLKEAGLTYLYVSIPTVNELFYHEIMGTSIKPIIDILSKIDDESLLKMIRIAIPKTKYYDYNEQKSVLGRYLLCAWDLEYRSGWNIDEKIASVVDKLEYTGPCDRPLDQMVISSNGDVIICCRDWRYENILGNIYNDNLYDIWHGDKMKSVQYSIIRQEYNNIDCCRDCNMNIDFYNKKVRKKYEKK